MFATLAWKHYLREPCLLERTTELHLRTTNFRLPALYFLNQIPSGLPLPPPFPVFLSKMDVFAQRDYNEQGIKQKDAAIFPPPPPSTYHPFISPSIFPSSAIYGKFFTLPPRLPPSFSPLIHPSSHTVVLVFFLKGKQHAMKVASTLREDFVAAKEFLCCKLSNHYSIKMSTLNAFTKKVCLFVCYT